MTQPMTNTVSTCGDTSHIVTEFELTLNNEQRARFSLCKDAANSNTRCLVTSFMEKLSAAEAENKRLRKQVEDSKRAFSVTCPCNGVPESDFEGDEKSNIDKFAKDLQRLNADLLEEKLRLITKWDEFEKEKAEFEKEKAEFEEELGNANDPAFVDGIVASLRTKNEELETQLEMHAAQEDFEFRQYDKLVTSLNEEAADKDEKHQKAIIGLEQKIENLEAKNAELQWEQNFEQILETKDFQIRKLKEELASAQGGVAQRRQNKIIIDTLQKEKTNLWTLIETERMQFLHEWRLVQSDYEQFETTVRDLNAKLAAVDPDHETQSVCPAWNRYYGPAAEVKTAAEVNTAAEVKTAAEVETAAEVKGFPKPGKSTKMTDGESTRLPHSGGQTRRKHGKRPEKHGLQFLHELFQ